MLSMFKEVALTFSLRLGHMMTRLDQMMEMARTARVTAWILRTACVMAWILRTARWPHHRERGPPNECDGCNRPEMKSSTGREPPSAKAMSPLRLGRETRAALRQHRREALYRHRFAQGRL